MDSVPHPCSQAGRRRVFNVVQQLPRGRAASPGIYSLCPGAPFTGCFFNDVAGERGGVDRASEHGIDVLPADFSMNGTVQAGVPAKVSAKIRSRPKS